MTLKEDPHVHRRIRAYLIQHNVDNEKLARALINYVQSHTAIATEKLKRDLNRCRVCGAVKKPGRG